MLVVLLQLLHLPAVRRELRLLVGLQLRELRLLTPHQAQLLLQLAELPVQRVLLLLVKRVPLRQLPLEHVLLFSGLFVCLVQLLLQILDSAIHQRHFLRVIRRQHLLARQRLHY